MRLVAFFLVVGLFAQEGPPPAVRVLGTPGILQAPSEIDTVAFSPDSRHVAAGTRGNGVIIWDIESRRDIRRIPGGENVTHLQYLSDGTHLVFMTSGTGGIGLTTQWDLKKNARVRTFQTPNNNGRFALTPDEKTLVVPEDGGSGIRAWDLATGEQTPGLKRAARSQPKVTYGVHHIAFSPDATLLACTDSWIKSEDRAPGDVRVQVSIWDWKGDTLKHSWLVDRQTCGWGGDLRWLPDGEHLLLVGTESSRVVKAADGTVVSKIKARCVPDPTFTRLYAMMDQELVTCDVMSGAKVGGFPIRPVRNPISETLSADGRWLATASMSQSVVLIDVKRRAHVAPTEDGFSRQPTAFYSADGQLLVSDGAVTLGYDAATGRVLTRFHRARYCVDAIDCLSDDGRRLFIAGGADGHAELWDTFRGERLGRVKPDGRGGIQRTCLSRDAKFGATLREGAGILQFYDLTSGEKLGRLDGPVHSFFKSVLHLKGCEWTSAGDRVYIACENSGWFRGAPPVKKGTGDLLSFTGAFDPKEGRIIHQFKDAAGAEVADASFLAFHEAADLVYLEGRKFHGLWKASDGSFLRDVDPPGPGARFSADGRRLIGREAIVLTASGRREYECRGFPSPSGTLVAAVDEPSVIRFLDTKTGLELARRNLRCPGKIVGIAWHPSERQVAVEVEKLPAAFQVEVFVPAHAAPLDADKLKNYLEIFSGRDDAKRTAAAADLAGALVAADGFDLFIGALEAERERRDLRRIRTMVAVLECLAGRKLPKPLKRLEELAKGTGASPLLEMSGDAWARVAAGNRATDLRAGHEKAGPIKLEWK